MRTNSGMTTRRPLWAALMAGALLLAGCSSNDTPDDVSANDSTTNNSAAGETSEAETAEDETTTDSETDSEANTDAASTDDGESAKVNTDTSSTTTQAAGSSTTATASAGPVGEAFDIGWPNGSALQVVGVRYDDTLNIRTDHDASSTVVTTVAPFASSPALVSQGDGWLLPNSAWWHVTADGTDAWAGHTYLGMLLPTSTDIFTQLQATMPGMVAGDVQGLADMVGAARADGPVPLVVISAEPEAADAIGGYATIDVIGLGDDSVKGERIDINYNFIFDDPTAANPQIVGFELTGASATAICGRGVSGTGCL